MKKTLLFIFLILASGLANAQVWAPAGATWHYSWAAWATDGYVKVQYVADSIVGGKSCKVLQVDIHTYNYTSHTYYNSPPKYEYTYLENNIVYYYRYGQFFKLYDFNALTGDSWVVANEDPIVACDSLGSVVVDSTGTTTINSYPLKYLRTSPGQNSQLGFSDRVIERIGGMVYMFPEPECVVDLPGAAGLRCYYDDQFGLYKPSGFPPACDYITGIDEYSMERTTVKIYPNPASSFIITEINFPLKGSVSMELSDVSGNRIRLIETSDVISKINIEDLKPGIYLVRVTDQSGFSWNSKIIKTD